VANRSPGGETWDAKDFPSRFDRSKSRMDPRSVARCIDQRRSLRQAEFFDGSFAA
jgi:hypothetical protein